MLIIGASSDGFVSSEKKKKIAIERVRRTTERVGIIIVLSWSSALIKSFHYLEPNPNTNIFCNLESAQAQRSNFDDYISFCPCYYAKSQTDASRAITNWNSIHSTAYTDSIRYCRTNVCAFFFKGFLFTQAALEARVFISGI